MNTKSSALGAHIDFLTVGYDDESSDDTGAQNYKSYNCYVAGKIENLPNHLIILLPYDGGHKVLEIAQLSWMGEFHKGQKNLVT